MYQTTLNSVMDLLGDKYEKCESLSPSLRLTKFVRLQQNDREEEKGIKREEINAVCDCAEKHHYMAPEIAPKGSEFVYGKLLSRLIVNQAGGVLENSGLCLHRFFGYPMIPGSAVKGIASHVAWCEWNDIPEEESARKLSFAEKIASVFGYPTNHKDLDDKLAANLEEEGWKDKKYSGTICFLDAVPYECNPRLVTDIITCHHKDYYEGKKDKAIDDEQLKLIPFLAVDKDATFKFTLVPLARCNDENMADAKKWLLDALTIHGAGAKTAAGYGWFKDITKEVNASLVEKLKREEAKQKIKSFELEIMGLVDRIGSDNPPTRDEFNLIKNKLNAIKDSNKDIYDRSIDSVNRVKNSLPKEDSFRSSLVEKTDKQFEGDCIKNFSKLDDSKKKTLVNFLREETGRGRELWNKLKGIQNGPLYSGIAEIRKYNKDILKQGKMPK